MRAFVALMLGEELGGRVARATAEALGSAARHFRRPRAEGLHATIVFLGEIGRAQVDRLEPALAAAVSGAPAPALRIGAAGAFPRPGRERVLWVGVSPVEGDLAQLRERVLSGLGQAGVAAARPGERFRPHVTVARPRSAGRVPEAFYALDLDLPWRPRELALVESVSSDGPQRYRPLARMPLVGCEV